MNQISIGTTSVTSDDTDEAPELTAADFARAQFQIADRPVSRTEWQIAVQSQVKTCRVTINIDEPIVEHLKILAGEKGYQALISHVLAEYIRNHISMARNS